MEDISLCDSFAFLPGAHILIYGYCPLEDVQKAAIFDSEVLTNDTCLYDMRNRETFGHLNESFYAKPNYIETYEFIYQCDQSMSIESLDSFSKIQTAFSKETYSSASIKIYPNLISSKLSFWNSFGISGSMSTERNRVMNMLTQMSSEIAMHSLKCTATAI